MSPRWELGGSVDAEDRPVSGFAQASARSHAKKHFLDPAQRWEQLEPEVPVGEIRTQLVALARTGAPEYSPPATDLLDQAVGAYKAKIINETTGAVIRVGRYKYAQATGSKPRWNLGVVSRGGVFTAFEKHGVSEWRTSYRPVPSKAVRGVPRTQDFINAAHRRLDDLVTRHLSRVARGGGRRP